MQPHRQLLGGRYELTSLIATGGMGQVWQARDTVLNRDVAVKVLRSEYTGDPSFLARFRAEAQLAAGLGHPNIATLFDYGEVPPQQPTDEHLAYLVMELVRGESLSGLLRREHRLSPDRTLDVLRQSAAGLAAAHAAGVVHRDVKPGNVLIGGDGTVKITDFGVAVSSSTVPLTKTGQVIGTAHYLSPEQAQGTRATAASDVYALGLVGYECLAGHRAFDAESSVQVALMQIRDSPAPLPDDVPSAVRQLIESATVKDPAQRFPDGAAFRAAVDDVIAGRPQHRSAPPARTSLLPAVPAAATAARTPDRAPATRVMPAVTAGPSPFDQQDDDREQDRPRRRRLLLPLLALLAVAAVVLGGLWLTGLGDDDGSGTATDPTTSAPPTSVSAPPSSAAVALVDVAAEDYLGRPVADVQAELQARGLVVSLEPVQTSATGDGLVTSVEPGGQLAPNSAVTVGYAVAPPPTTAPTPTATPTDDNGTDEDETDENEPDESEGSKSNGKGNGKGNGRGNG